jgi:hypothetical protein
MAQTLRFTFFGSVMPHSVAATMSQCSKAETNSGAFQDCGEASAAVSKIPTPRNRRRRTTGWLQLFAVGRGDLRSLAFGAMVAPEVVFAERLHVLAHGNDRGSRGVERDGFHLIAGDAGFLQGLARGGGQRAHVVVMRLGGVFRIFALAVQWIFGDGGLRADRARCPR